MNITINQFTYRIDTEIQLLILLVFWKELNRFRGLNES
jgi:hypothetical protein